MSLKEILEYKLLEIGTHTITVLEIVLSVSILVIGFILSKIVRRLIYKTDRLDLGKKYAFSQVLHYVLVIIIFFLSMNALGINISPLLVGSGAILVGIGLGLQNLFLDFISGVIILFDRSIQAGDVVEIEGTIGKVQDIKMRTTTILTRDNKNVIFPNSFLTKEKLINFSFNDEVVTFDIAVGVHYDTDINLAERLMIAAALENDEVLHDPQPIVRLENFGDSSLDLKLYYSSKNLFRQPGIRSTIRRVILEKFRQNNINIPYPIRTLEYTKESTQ